MYGVLRQRLGTFLSDYDYIPHQQGHTHGLLEAIDSLEGYH